MSVRQATGRPSARNAKRGWGTTAKVGALGGVLIVSMVVGMYVVGPRIKGAGKPLAASPKPQPNPGEVRAVEQHPVGGVQVVELPPPPRPRRRQPKPPLPSAPPSYAGTAEPAPEEPQPQAAEPATPPEETAQPAAAEPTAPPPPPAEHKSFRVQAGVFEDPDNAQALADSLQAQGFSPAITTARTGGKVLYRVQVGVFSSREGAKEMADQLSSKGFQAYIAED